MALDDQIEKLLEQAKNAENKTSPETISKQETSDNFELPDLLQEEETKQEGKEGEGVKVSSNLKQKSKSLKPVTKPVELKEVEGILADNFKEIYTKLSPSIQKEFKDRGEEAAEKIIQAMKSPKFNVSSILDIIKKWLFVVKKLPGINKLFLEQQAKIKTDKVVLMKQDMDKKNNNLL